MKSQDNDTKRASTLTAPRFRALLPLVLGVGLAGYFGVMLTKAGLADIKTYADGIGPWKFMLLTHKVSPWRDTNADGTAYSGALADVNSIEANSVIADAHAAGLFVHAYTFRNEAKYLAGLYKGDPQAEHMKYFHAGVDGVFTDFANTGFAARAAYLTEVGR